MTKTISVRLDNEAERALRLLESRGLGRSEAIRRALVESATGEHGSVLEAEVARIAADPDDRREIAEIQALLDELSEPW